MKTQSIAKLWRFPADLKGQTGQYTFSSATIKARSVKVIPDVNGGYVALPIITEHDGYERVAFHAKTIKSLVVFLEGK